MARRACGPTGRSWTPCAVDAGPDPPAGRRPRSAPTAAFGADGTRLGRRATAIRAPASRSATAPGTARSRQRRTRDERVYRGGVTNGTRVALALGGGGARGYAHIGVLRELESRGYEIVAVAGTSMGAVIGGLYCAGKLDPYTEWVTGLSQRDVIRLLDPSIKAPGLIKAEKVMSVVRDLLDGGPHRGPAHPVHGRGHRPDRPARGVVPGRPGGGRAARLDRHPERHRAGRRRRPAAGRRRPAQHPADHATDLGQGRRRHRRVAGRRPHDAGHRADDQAVPRGRRGPRRGYRWGCAPSTSSRWRSSPCSGSSRATGCRGTRPTSSSRCPRTPPAPSTSIVRRS